MSLANASAPSSTRYRHRVPAASAPRGMVSTDAGTESVATGVYFYQLTARDFTQTRKMLLLK